MAVFTDALIKAINDSGVTLYRIAKDAEMDYSVLSRFYHRERALTLTSADKLATYFNLQVTVKRAKRK